MTALLKQVTTTADFTVTGVDPMDSYLGPDATMDPYAARVQFLDGGLVEITVWGWIIRNGKVTKQHAMVDFRPHDLLGELPPGADPDDHVPMTVPAWVHQLPVRAAIGRTS